MKLRNATLGDDTILTCIGLLAADGNPVQTSTRIGRNKFNDYRIGRFVPMLLNALFILATLY